MSIIIISNKLMFGTRHQHGIREIINLFTLMFLMASGPAQDNYNNNNYKAWGRA